MWATRRHQEIYAQYENSKRGGGSNDANNPNDDAEEKQQFIALYREQHAQRLRMQDELDRIGIQLEVQKIDTDYCDLIVFDGSGKQGYDVGISVRIHLHCPEFGNSHENVGYGTVQHESRNVALMRAKHMALQDAVARGVRMFNEGGNYLSGYYQQKQLQQHRR